MQDHVIRASYDDMSHIGIECTVELIKRVYLFLKFKELVKKYIERIALSV